MKKLPVPLGQNLIPNNFNLIRLAAALQVFTIHWAELVEEPRFRWCYHHLLEPFPGVPIFFFVSGFLIAPAFHRSVSVYDFYRNRVLRIYPALLVCLAVCVLGLIALRNPGLRHASARSIAGWLVAQATIFQKYNPPWLKLHGHWLNAPLWTVMIELQFYAITPWLLARGGSPRRLAWLTGIGLVVSLGFSFWRPPADPLGHLAFVAYIDSFVPFVWMFLAGAWCAENKDVVLAAVRRWPWWVVLALAAALVVVAAFPCAWTGYLQFPLLAALILKLAYIRPTLADRTIGGTDLSYGIYIYHYPIIQLALFAELGPRLIGLTPLGVLLMAGMSWRLVEKPALALKHRVA